MALCFQEYPRERCILFSLSPEVMHYPRRTAGVIESTAKNSPRKTFATVPSFGSSGECREGWEVLGMLKVTRMYVKTTMKMLEGDEDVNKD